MTLEHASRTDTYRSGEKRTVFKSSKQILNADSQMNYPPGAVLFHHIASPPSLKPRMKISDLSGIPTSYTDPSTSLNYADRKEFESIRYLPPEVVNGYLSLRGVQIQ